MGRLILCNVASEIGNEVCSSSPPLVPTYSDMPHTQTHIKEMCVYVCALHIHLRVSVGFTRAPSSWSNVFMWCKSSCPNLLMQRSFQYIFFFFRSVEQYNQSHTFLLSIWMQWPIRGIYISQCWNYWSFLQCMSALTKLQLHLLFDHLYIYNL